MACYGLARFDEAEQLGRRALGIRESQLGTQHPDVAFALSRLAMALWAQGETSDAEQLLDGESDARKEPATHHRRGDEPDTFFGSPGHETSNESLSVTKANVVKTSDGKFLNKFEEISKDYPDIEAELAVVIAKVAKEMGIAVGPGRGSAAGSLVAYALEITDIDPMKYDLLFERFLNPERVSMPDFDIDFCMDRREEVIRYVQDKYGRDKVGQIITFGALLSKAAVRDVGRVLQMPYGQVDRLSKMIPVEGVKPVSIEKALADEPRLREEAKNEEVVDRLLTYAQQVEGLLRNASTHAAGVVIGDRPLDELVPLYQDPRSDMPATQFNMKWVEQAGLVKFDFLGLKTLTVIHQAMGLIEETRGVRIDLDATPLDDPETYRLLARGDTERSSVYSK